MTTAALPRLNYTRKELAAAFRLSERTIDRLRKAGKIPSYSEGRTRLFPVEAVEAYRRAQMEQGADPSP